MPADGELTATPRRRLGLLIWADNAHLAGSSRRPVSRPLVRATCGGIGGDGYRPTVGSFHPEGWKAAVRKLVITQNVTVDGSIEMLDDWFDP